MSKRKKTNKRPKKARVLAGYKRVGKKLIPPLMQIENMMTFSYVDSLLPDFIWLSALFLRSSDREAVEKSIAFVRMCHEVVGREDVHPLSSFQNFYQLDARERETIRKRADELELRQFLCRELRHQHRLITKYPLAFLFDEQAQEDSSEENIRLLTEDVGALLDRYSHHATKVQTTAFVCKLATGKMHLNSSIPLPDFDKVITDPDSAEALRAASFVRANANAGMPMREDTDLDWARHFWAEAYALRGCQ